MTIEQLQQPVAAEYSRFEQEYRARVLGQSPLLDGVGDYLERHRGKRLRPLLLLLAAKASGALNDKHVLLAAAMELLHNATLMHDDVVDESDARRGAPSVRGHWGNQVAVLCGDYYLAQAMQLIQKVESPEASSIVVETVKEMSRGELMQLSVTGGGHPEGGAGCGRATLEQYMQVIGAKTASFLAACCQLGGMERDFGYHYGIVFQLRDDLGSLNPDHDASIPEDVDPQNLIDEHTRLALEVLDAYPPSDALDALRALLLPSAPQPS